MSGTEGVAYDLYLTSLVSGQEQHVGVYQFDSANGDSTNEVDILTWYAGHSALSVVHPAGVESFQFFK